CIQDQGVLATEFKYALKTVFGKIFTSQDNVATPLAPGRYWTAINILNFNKCQTAHFRWKVAVAGTDAPGAISPFQKTRELKPDEAVEIDCPQIIRALTT